jgi:hypothetical protein
MSHAAPEETGEGVASEDDVAAAAQVLAFKDFTTVWPVARVESVEGLAVGQPREDAP